MRIPGQMFATPDTKLLTYPCLDHGDNLQGRGVGDTLY